MKIKKGKRNSNAFQQSPNNNQIHGLSPTFNTRHKLGESFIDELSTQYMQTKYGDWCNEAN